MSVFISKKGYIELDDLSGMNAKFLDDDVAYFRYKDGWRLWFWCDEDENWYSPDEYVFSSERELLDFVRDMFYVESPEFGYELDFSGVGKHKQGRRYGLREDDDYRYSITDLEDIISDIVEFEKNRGRQPAAWVKDEDIWEKAKEIADKADVDNYWAFVTYMYKKLGGRIG